MIRYGCPKTLEVSVIVLYVGIKAHYTTRIKLNKTPKIYITTRSLKLRMTVLRLCAIEPIPVKTFQDTLRLLL